MTNLRNSSGSERFFVQSTNEDNNEFVNRQKSVFEQLDAVARDKEKSIDSQNTRKRERNATTEHSNKKLKCDTRPFRGQESIFKQPEAPPPARFKINNIPDHKRNPQNWIKYTLSDVSQDDMSDKSNTAAAMSFLRELKAKKDLEEMEIDSQPDEKIKFRKPSSKTCFISEQSSNSSSISMHDVSHDSTNFISSKVIMPEYVIGVKKIPKKKVKQILNDKTKKINEIKLGHLDEFDDE